MLEWEVNAQLRSPHAIDVPLVFNNVAASAGIAAAPNSQAVADQMSDAWIAFARTGNPSSKSLPTWSAYDLTRRANMIFNAKSRVVDDYNKEAREFWEKT